jgi:hypothetical protein
MFRTFIRLYVFAPLHVERYTCKVCRNFHTVRLVVHQPNVDKIGPNLDVRDNVVEQLGRQTSHQSHYYRSDATESAENIHMWLGVFSINTSNASCERVAASALC